MTYTAKIGFTKAEIFSNLFYQLFNLAKKLMFASRAGVSNSNCSEGQITTCKVTRAPRNDTDATRAFAWTLLETSFTSYFQRKVSSVTGKSCLAVSTLV